MMGHQYIEIIHKRGSFMKSLQTLILGMILLLPTSVLAADGYWDFMIMDQDVWFFVDGDGDGLADDADNCPGVNNPGQEDGDGDGIGDTCDTCPNDSLNDADGDGVCGDVDLCPGFDDTVDGDGDGTPDGCDLCPGFDDNLDDDGDGLANGCDLCPGYDDFVDSDGDGTADGCDLCLGYDDTADQDGDDTPDDCDSAPNDPSATDAYGTKVQLTDNGLDDTNPDFGIMNYDGSVSNPPPAIVWQGDDGTDNEIFYYDGSATSQLTDNLLEDSNPDLGVYQYGGSATTFPVVWQGDDGSDQEIFYYDGSSTTQLTDNGIDDLNPDAGGAYFWFSRVPVIWQGDDGSDFEIFYYDGSQPAYQLTNNSVDDVNPDFGVFNYGGSITTERVWQSHDGSDFEIFGYQGSPAAAIPFTDNGLDDTNPDFGAFSYSGSWLTVSQVPRVWQRHDGNDWEVFYYDGSSTTQLTDNDFDDTNPDMEAFLYDGTFVTTNVIWQGYDGHDFEIFYYDGSSTIQQTNNAFDDTQPDFEAFLYDGSQYRAGIPEGAMPKRAVWQSHDGNDWEIILGILDKHDFDGDGVADSVDMYSYDPAESTDSDGDGIGDNSDPCPFDALDDADGDGVCGDIDICPGFDDNVDADGDGIPDGCDNYPYVLGGSAANPGLTCGQIRANGGSADGIYWLDPDGILGSPPIQVYCDMSSDGGGWTLAMNSVLGDEALTTDIVSNTGVVDLSTAHTRNLADWAVSQAAELRHQIIDTSNGQIFDGKYVAAYHDPMALFADWTTIGAHTSGADQMLVDSYGMAWSTFDSDNDTWAVGNCSSLYGNIPWYYSACYMTLPSQLSDGPTQGPITFHPSMTYIDRYSIWIRELATPALADTDGDSVQNALDMCPGFNDLTDNDGDGTPDDCDPDDDNDGLSDSDEFMFITDPLNPDTDGDTILDGQEIIDGTSPALADTDNDGSRDDVDVDPLVPNNGAQTLNGVYHQGAIWDAMVMSGGYYSTHRYFIYHDGTVKHTSDLVVQSSVDPIIPGNSYPGYYWINSDNTFTIPPAQSVKGIISQNQSLMVYGPNYIIDGAVILRLNGKKSSGMTETNLSGYYVFSQYIDETFSSSPNISTSRMLLAFDGTGSVDYSTLANSNVSNDSGSDTYSVADDGTLDMFDSTGFVTLDNEVIMLVDTTVNADPLVDDEIFLGLGVRQGSNMSVADLAGEFIYFEMGYEAHTWASRVVYTFNGVGGGTMERTDDSDGQTTPAPVPFTYSVDTDGNVRIDGRLAGVLSSNTEYLVFADTNWADAEPGLSMGIGVKSGNVIPTCIDSIQNGDETDIDAGGHCDVQFTPLNDTAEFVKQVYRDFLNREADQAGLDYWVTGIDGGALSRAECVESFLQSAEFGGNISPVTRLYFAYFLRIPDYDGLMYWIGQYEAGMTLNEISESFALSAEFTTTYGSLSNSEFVTLVYQNVLERAPDQAGLDYWSNQLDTAANTRGEVMTGFSESVEYLANSASEIYVTMTYIGLLRRAPDQAGYDYWVGVLDGGNSGLGLIDGFLASPEYANRF